MRNSNALASEQRDAKVAVAVAVAVDTTCRCGVDVVGEMSCMSQLEGFSEGSGNVGTFV